MGTTEQEAAEVSLDRGDANDPKEPVGPLVQQIRMALSRLRLEQGRLYVSVASEPKWEPSPSGDQVLVRWMCWSVEDNDEEVLEPTFEVLSPAVTATRLRNELPQAFPSLALFVDENIEV